MSDDVDFVSVLLVLGSAWLGRGWDEAVESGGWIVPRSRQFRRQIHSQPQLPVSRIDASHPH